MIRSDVAYEMRTRGGVKLRKGFTLIELLIVMVVIAILSAAMMLASEEVSYSAYASTVINNLKIWQKASLAFYMDHIDEASKPTFNPYNSRDVIAKYIDNADGLTNYKDGPKYNPIRSSDGVWYIHVHIGKINSSKGGDGIFRGAQARLAAKAESLGLFAASDVGYYKTAERSTNKIEYEKGVPRIYGNPKFDNSHDKNCLIMRVF